MTTTNVKSDSEGNGKNGLVQSGSATTLKAALEYAKKGWYVLPLHTPTKDGRCDCHKADCKIGKHPRTMHGLKDATTDEATIRRWWAMWPTSNIGIVTGNLSGFVVLDVDPQHGGDRSLAYLQDEGNELPKTLTAKTGGGGSHIFFSCPKDGLRGSVGKIAEGLDVRGDGNYIVAPPSLHASGERYAWKNKEEMAVMPEWLLGLARKRQRPESSKLGELISEGKRNATLASLAGAMRYKGCEESEIELLLLEVNKRRCVPHLSEDEVRGIATSISRYDSKPDEVNNSRDPEFDTSKKESKHVVFESASELLAREFAEPKWAVKDLLSEGATVFAGAPKVGKSFLALGLATAIATGGRALGSIPVEKGDVLYLALEDGPKRIQKRLRRILDQCGTPERLTFAYKCPLISGGGLNAIEGWLGDHPEARLIVVDTLKRLRPLESGNKRLYDNDYNAVAPLNDLGQSYGVAVLIIHHSTKIKDTGDWFDEISGSLGLSAAVDNAMLLRRGRGESKGTLHVAGRDIDDKNLDVQMDGLIQTWKLLGDALGDLAAKILDWLREADKAGLSRTEINKKNGGRSEGMADAFAELRAKGLADSRPIPTAGKPQERWFATEFLPTTDDNDDNDDIGTETTNLSSSISSTSLGQHTQTEPPSDSGLPLF